MFDSLSSEQQSNVAASRLAPEEPAYGVRFVFLFF